MVEVMTDKATVTITAPKAGTVVETRGKVGEIVPVHSVLVVFELEGDGGELRPRRRNRTRSTARPAARKAGRDRGGRSQRVSSRDGAAHRR